MHQITQLRNAGIIRGNGPHQVILFVIIRLGVIRRIDILGCVYLEGNRRQVPGDIFKEMLHGTLGVVQEAYLIQELALFVDDQQRRRDFILHFHLLDLGRILHGKDHIGSTDIAVGFQY